jgi:hypothetical protein
MRAGGPDEHLDGGVGGYVVGGRDAAEFQTTRRQKQQCTKAAQWACSFLPKRV